jgi:hypothetical protein
MNWLHAIGIDLRESARHIRRIPWFWRQYRSLKTQSASTGSQWQIQPSFPCLDDIDAQGGTASGHYFHQDQLVARRIFSAQPDRHLDVGSRIDGFVAHVAVFRPIEVVDIRPIKSVPLTNISFTQADLMSMPHELIECCDSLSCLHALEHFGLGRYGDPLDIDGYVAGFKNMARMVRRRGIFYLSVPVGRQRIEFNAHRVFAPTTIASLAADAFDLERFSFVDDAGDLHEDAGFAGSTVQIVATLNYGCGIFEFRKR